MVWGQLPADGMELMVDEIGDDGPEYGEQDRRVHGGVVCNLLGDDGYKVIPDDGVDFLDADQVSGLWIGLSFDGELDFVVSSKP